MSILPFTILLFSILFLPHATRSTQSCKISYCGEPGQGPVLDFPFQLRGSNNESSRCGYPGFEVVCNNKIQTLLTLANGAELVVTRIYFDQQKLLINDECLPRRFMSDFDLTGSPFNWSNVYRKFENRNFFNCTSNNTTAFVSALLLVDPIPCMGSGNGNYVIVATVRDSLLPLPCRFISSALIPVEEIKPRQPALHLYGDIELQWSEPDCTACGYNSCGFLNETGLEVGCYNKFETQGPLKNAKLSVILGMGMVGLLLGLVCMLSGKVNWNGDTSRQTSIETNIAQPTVVAMGLEDSSIEKFPTIQLSERGQLPGSSDDSLCSICLCKYEPNEILRAIPQCNHYFHANCIDGWLKINATCPLCRNLSKGYALVTPSLPVSTT